MSIYNHAFCFAFAIENASPDGQTTAAELRRAIFARLETIEDWELLENCGAPFDTYEVA